MNKSPSLILALLLPGLLPVVASGESLPKMKPGLWEVTSDNKKMPMKQQICIDEGTQERMTKGAVEAFGASCSEPTITRDGAVYTTTTSCSFMGQRSTTTSRITVVSENELVQEVSGEEDGMMRSTNRYKGPCPAGMKGGDMRMGDSGQSVNIEQFKDLGKMIGKMGTEMNTGAGR